MMTQTNPATSKSLWGYGIAGVYAVFAIATLCFVAFTMTQKIELVTPDYYAKEIGYEQQINRVRLANELTQPITCLLSQDGKYIRIKFPAQQSAAMGIIKLYRPSESLLDFSLPIEANEEGLQLIETTKMKSGAWRIQITWNSANHEFYNEFLLQLR